MTRHLEGWRLAGACAGHPDPSLWFADDPAGITVAKAVCGRCQVRDVCLADALARGEEWGVLGGLDPAERRALGVPRPVVHGSRGRYAEGCRCDLCRRANAAYMAGWRTRRAPVTARPTLVVAVLERTTGRGRHRAFPGQLYLIGAA